MEVFSLAVRLKEEGAAAVNSALEKLRLSSVLTAAAISGGLAVALRKMADESSVAQAAQAQLESAIRSTGGVAGQSAEALNAHASALQSVTAYGDDAVTSAQALLLTFTQIRGNTFTQATEAVLNVATAMGTDLKSAAIQVGKALNDPILGVSALARSGIQFSEAQKEAIKTLVETGRQAEAQRIILKELETQFGGSAKAARETLGGALAGLQNDFGDLFEFTKDESRVAIDAINGLGAAVRALGNALDYTVPVAVALGGALVAVNFRLIASTVGMLGNTMLALAGSLSLATIKQYALNTAMMANPMGLLIGAATALTSAMLVYAEREKDAAEARDEAIAQSEEYKNALEAVRQRRENLTAAEAQAAGQQKANDAAQAGRQDDLVRLAGLTRLNSSEMRELITAEAGYAAALRMGTLPLNQRVMALEKQKALQDAINSQMPVTANGFKLSDAAMQKASDTAEGYYQRIKKLREELAKEEAEAARKAKEEQVARVGVSASIPSPIAAKDLYAGLRNPIKEQTARMAIEIKSTLTQAIKDSIEGGFVSGITAALSTGRIADAWRSMSQSIIQNMASAMVKVALEAIKFASLLDRVREFMILNPKLAVLSAAALLALAYNNGGKAQSTGMGVSGGAGGAQYSPMMPSMGTVAPTQVIFGQTSATTAAGMTPRSATNVTIIGPDDPKAQRAIQELISKGNTRGTLG